jgi:hypothetical protein
VHFVTRLEAMPRHRERVVHPTWEKFEACEGAIHFAPYYLTSEKPLPARPDYAELQDLLERELLRKGLIVLRGFEPQPWLLDGAVSAVIGKHLPQQKRSAWPELWHRRKEDRMSRLAWLCGEGIHGDLGLCFAHQSNPWITPVLRYLRETRGSRVVVETLRTVESPQELLSVLAPELSEKSLRAFDDNFETYAQQHWSELIPPPAGASSPAP